MSRNIGEMTPSPTPSKRPILERILEEAHAFSASQGRFLAVFDLDSTLFDLTLRISGIIDSFVEEHQNGSPFAEACEALKKIQILRRDWGLAHPLSRVGITPESHPELCRELLEHWAHQFFSDRHLHRDQPLPGAVEYVRELKRLGADIMYLTGRDVPRMQKGTEESLRAWGFPLDEPQVQLVLKSFTEVGDAEFKVDVLKVAEKTYERIWLFENEPVNLNLVSRHCPEIGLVYIDTTHSGVEEVAEELDRIEHFEVDLAQFRTYLHRNQRG